MYIYVLLCVLTKDRSINQHILLPKLSKVHGGCVGEGIQDGDCTVAFNLHGESLEEECLLLLLSLLL